MRILALGDVHAPFCLWELVEGASWFADAYKPDRIVQVGDLIDAYSWSRYPKSPSAPSPSEEWDATVAALTRIHNTFDHKFPWTIVEGNHDRRFQSRAFEASLPKQLVKPLQEHFPFPNWTWHTDCRPLIIEGVRYVHGDEALGTAFAKACRTGHSVVQGHLHKDAAVKYSTTHDDEVWGMDVGCMMDLKKLAAHYARKSLLQAWLGWATITDGIPHLYPWKKMRRMKRLAQAKPASRRA